MLCLVGLNKAQFLVARRGRLGAGVDGRVVVFHRLWAGVRRLVHRGAAEGRFGLHGGAGERGLAGVDGGAGDRAFAL